TARTGGVMANYIGIPILLLAAVINATIMPELRLGNGTADLVFLLVMSWALLADVRDAMLWAVIGGMLQDVLSIAPLGTSALGLGIVAFAADAVAARHVRAGAGDRGVRSRCSFRDRLAREPDRAAGRGRRGDVCVPDDHAAPAADAWP